MFEDKYNKYVELFAQLYSEGKIDVRWGREIVGFRPLIKIEEIISNLDPSCSEEEFIEVALDSLHILRELALGRKPKDEEKSEIISVAFLKDQDILDHVRVHTSSFVNTLNNIDYEISTRRNKENPNLVLGYSIILNFLYSNPIDPEENNRFSIELTTKELRQLVKKFTEIIESVEKLGTSTKEGENI